MTSSERYFERFCERRGIAIRRLPEGPDPTPDYEIVVDGLEIVAEVKQIEPNAEDRDVLTEVTNGKAVSYWVNMSRARQSILDGVKQLRAYAKGKRPAIVVLYELAGLLEYLKADNIAQCLYGRRQVHVAVPEDAGQEGWVLGSSYGGGRVATEHHNTTLSAVAVLRTSGGTETVSVFHNAFAALPIEPYRFRFDGVRHFAWRTSDPNRLPGWVDVTITAA
jgi:hypothetical protein